MLGIGILSMRMLGTGFFSICGFRLFWEFAGACGFKLGLAAGIGVVLGVMRSII